MKQIFNWTIGSFFRTIGRTIALLVLGALLYFIVSSNDIRLTDLFVLKIHASSYTTNVVYSQTGYVNSSDTTWTSDDVFYKRNISPNANIQRYKLNIDNLSSNAQYVEFNYLISQPQTSVLSYTSTEDYCIEWKWKTITTNEGVTEWYCSKYDSNTINDHVARTPQVSGLNLYFYVDYANGGGWANCETIENNFVMCPTNGLPINGITALVNYTNAGTSTFQLAINRIIAYYNQDNSVSSAINNQTQQQQQQHNEMMNDTTTDAENEAADFFSDFDVPDVGGLSAIITAPLNTIQSLLSNSCSNLVLPLPFVNQNLTLPCLGSIYSQHFGAFFTLYQTIILAIVSYRCIRSIYFDIHGFTDPNDDRIEVMDL